MLILEKFKRLSTKQKMYIGFGGVLGIMVLVIIKSIYAIGSLSSSTDSVFNTYQPAATRAMVIGNKLEESLSDLGYYLLSKESLEKEQYEANLNELLKNINDFKKEDIYSNDETVGQRIDNIDATLSNLIKDQQDIIEVSNDRSLNFIAANYAQKAINPINQAALQDLGIFLDSEYSEHGNKARIDIVAAAGNLRYSWVRMMSDMRAFLGFRSPGNIEQIRIYITAYRQELLKLEGKHLAYTFEQEEIIGRLHDYIDNYETELEKIIVIHSGDSWRKDSDIYRTQIRQHITILHEDITALANYLIDKTGEYATTTSMTVTSTGIIVVILLIFAIVAILALWHLLTRGIIQPMTKAVDNSLVTLNGVMEMMSGEKVDTSTANHDADEIEKVETTLAMMTDTLADIAEKQVHTTTTLKEEINRILHVVEMTADGDLTGRMTGFSGDDDVVYLAAGVQQMIDSLNDLVAQVQMSGIQVTSAATEIAATARQQEASVTEQAASTNQIMATATQISATTQELANTMREVAEVADNTATSAAEGQTALTNMEKTMHQMHEATASISSKLAVLSEKAANINTVVTTITKVADQTNLLSLNAAIEAEKAGEYGLGFAVVATEIRRLADQTAVATWDIEQMVKEMQSAVSAGVMGMDKFSEEVNRGVDEVQQIGSQLADIIESVQTLTPRFEYVNDGMQSQSLGAQQISESMVQLNESAQQTVESLRQSTLSIESLKDAAQDLQQGVSRFRVG